MKNRPVNKVSENTEDFHVNGTIENIRVPSRLADDIGHLVQRLLIEL